MTGVELARIAGWSAWIAAAATLVGAITLVVFFKRGGRWGMWNDIASVVLMLAMIPVALVLTIISLEVVTTIALVIGAIGIVAMLILAVAQTLLVIGRVTYEQSKPVVLGIGAVVGVWYLLVAVSTAGTDLPDGLRLAAAVAGVGFIAVGIGFARGGEQHPLSAIGGGVLFVASLVFLVWIGALLIGGGLTVPAWNA